MDPGHKKWPSLFISVVASLLPLSRKAEEALKVHGDVKKQLCARYEQNGGQRCSNIAFCEMVTLASHSC